MWVARNKNGTLYLFIQRPTRIRGGVLFNNYWEDIGMLSFQIPADLFPNLKWKDEPIEVNLYTKEQIEDIRHISYEKGYEDTLKEN